MYSLTLYISDLRVKVIGPKQPIFGIADSRKDKSHSDLEFKIGCIKRIQLFQEGNRSFGHSNERSLPYREPEFRRKA